MDFKILHTVAALEEIDELSKTKKQVLFKHSTRCPVSGLAKKILVSEFSSDMEKQFDIYYLDLLLNRELSKAIESRYSIKHESPQILVISNGVCIYHASHDMVSLEKALSKCL